MSEVLLSQLAYAELISPKPDETVRWLIDVLGLEETTREGQSVYLRGFCEFLHSSLIVTEGPEPALGRVGFRTYGPEDPEIISKRVEGEWLPERTGRGAAYQYKLPAGRYPVEVFWRPSAMWRRPRRPRTISSFARRSTRAVARWPATSTTSPSPRRTSRATSTSSGSSATARRRRSA